MGKRLRTDISLIKHLIELAKRGIIIKRRIEEYRKLLYNPYVAASQGYINAVIQPKDTRPTIIAALEALGNKKETRPARKHDNIPM